MKTEGKNEPGRAAKAIRGIVEVAKKTKARALATRAKRGEALIALIERRKARIVEDFYDIGEALKEIQDAKLYEALGHESFAALLAARELVSPTVAKKLLAIVDHVPRDQALRLGQEKSYALVSYAAATPEADIPAELAAVDAEIAGRPVSKASVRELRDAARAVRAKKPKSAAQKASAKETALALAAVKKRVAAWKVGKIDVVAKRGTIVITLREEQAQRL